MAIFLDDEQVRHDVNELMRFDRAVQETVGSRPAISLPSATMPIAFYARTPQELIDLDPPQIEATHQCLLTCQNKFLAKVLNGLTWQMALVPAGVDVARQITLENPDGERAPTSRVVTPRWTIDTDEWFFGHHTTAMIMLASVRGIWEEVALKAKIAREQAREQWPEGQLTEANQYREIEAYAKRDAWMLEFMATTIGCGWVQPIDSLEEEETDEAESKVQA